MTVNLQQLKGCKDLKLVCERGTSQWKVFERGTFFIRNGI